MNNYSTIGRLTRDPETTFTPSGKSITSFAIALDVGFGDKKKTIFWECKLWGERGETFAKYVFKGHQVGIEARIDQEEWNDKATGEQRKKLVLVVNDFTLLSNGEKGQSQGAPMKPAAAPRKMATAAVADESFDDADSIPF